MQDATEIDWKLVIVESPFAGKGRTREEKLADQAVNESYARACMKDCLGRGEAPYASHMLYTQPGVLDDDDPGERAKGIHAGLAWGRVADKVVVYTDRGISSGMQEGIARAESQQRPVEMRTVPGWSGEP